VGAQVDCDARVLMGSVRGGWWEGYLYVDICDKKYPIDEAEKGAFNCVLGRSAKRRVECTEVSHNRLPLEG